MALTAKDKGGGRDFKPVPQGLHTAICYAVFDLGTHYNERFNNDRHEVVVVWEMPNQRIEIEKEGQRLDLPRAISKRYTLSLHIKANLRQELESWRGKKFTKKELEGFNLENLLGVNCQLNVIHNDSSDGQKTYANVSAVVPPPSGIKLKPENPLVSFSFEDWPTKGIPVGTPEWIQDIIKRSQEWTGQITPSADDVPIDDHVPPEEDDIPF